MSEPLQRWIVCPYCDKKALPLADTTRIEHLFIQCRGSNCKRVFEADTVQNLNIAYLNVRSNK